MEFNETEEQRRHLERQIVTAQRRAASTADRAHLQVSAVAGLLPKPVNEQQEISRVAADLETRIADGKVEGRIIWKVATALVQRRVPEHMIYGITAALSHATNRGAYFVAAVKRAFEKSNLSWHTEEWE